MQKTISKLWRDDISKEINSNRSDPEIKRLEELIYRNYEKLTASVSHESKEILDKYTDCMNDYTDLYAEAAFCDGFSLGVKLTAEALQK